LEKHYLQLKDALAKVERDEQLLTVLEYYGSTLAAGKEREDLPLYDFVKITAAIAHCLESGNGKLRLAGGSVSGIQTYLYEIISKQAAKLLKGRSFYLHLLTDSLADAFLKKFGLSPCHIVYSSGGGFYILLPDQDNVGDHFEGFKADVTRKIYKEHKTNLNVEFALTESFDNQQDVKKIWDELFKKLNERKFQRLSDNPDLLRDLVDFVEHGGETKRDQITNEEIDDEDDEVRVDEEDPTKGVIHRNTNAQIELGKQLKDADWWVTSKKSINGGFLDPLGNWHILNDKMRSNLPNDAVIRRINVPDPHLPNMFYGGNSFPVFEEAQEIDGVLFKRGEPKTFDILAKGNNFDRLCILRMDVDGLGKIFSDDIGANPSFARYAAVSRSLDWFFKGWLNEIQKQWSQTTLIVYSGGDDLFILGKWNDVLEIALKIYEDFKDWSGSNLTISGGLAVLPAKFPVMQGAKLAEQAEKAAKEYTLNGKKEKNAFCLFGRAIHWEREMVEVVRLKNILLDLLTEKKVHKSLLTRINAYAAAREYQESENLTPRWIWTMLYDLSRFEDSLKKRNPEAAEQIKLLRDTAFEDKAKKDNKVANSYLYLMQVAARWAELEIKTEGKEELQEH
jgi:CRISPR-associated protein Csm1